VQKIENTQKSVISLCRDRTKSVKLLLYKRLNVNIIHSFLFLKVKQHLQKRLWWKMHC